MAFTYGFYNALNGDRKYNAEQVSAIFDGIIKDGVFNSIGELLATVPGEGMQVIVKTGRAWFNRTWSELDAWLPLNIEPADVLLERYDAVVLEVDSSDAIRANSIKIITGTPAITPEKPTMKNDTHIHQHPLAYILVPASATEISKSDITINVGQSTCPFVSGILSSVDITDLFQEWEGDFEIWFENLKSQMEGDIVANLQRQIDALGDGLDNTYTKQQTLQPATAALYNLPTEAVPDDVFKILGHSCNPPLLLSATTPGTITWVAPPLDNAPLIRKYTIGVLLIGGGGSGAAQTWYSTTSIENLAAGASGRVTCFMFTVTVGQSYTIVVGNGGAPRTINAGLTDVVRGSGNSGGTTSAFGKSALGGEGGKNYDQNSTGTAIDGKTQMIGGAQAAIYLYKNATNNINNSVVNWRGLKPEKGLVVPANLCNTTQGYMQGTNYPNEVFNPFTRSMLDLSAGQSCCGLDKGGVGTGGGLAVTANRGTAVASLSTITAPAASLPGCGGGVAHHVGRMSDGRYMGAVSGAGASGAVYIYLMGV